MENTPQFNDILLYSTTNGGVKVEVLYEDETFWLNQKRMAELFGVESNTVTYHLKEIFKSEELDEKATTRKIRVVQKEGNREVNPIVTMYLDYAENQAERQKALYMRDWVEKLDAFLKFNDYDVLTNAGKVSAEVAKTLALEECEKFRPIQDQIFESDFDKEIKKLKEKGTPQ